MAVNLRISKSPIKGKPLVLWGSIPSPIPRGSMAWVRARRASLALLPQLPRHNKSNSGADVHCVQARPRSWRADAQCEGRWASWVAGPLARGVCPVASNPVGDLVHAGFEFL